MDSAAIIIQVIRALSHLNNQMPDNDGYFICLSFKIQSLCDAKSNKKFRNIVWIFAWQESNGKSTYKHHDLAEEINNTVD